jgi:hypothetical protein
MTVAMRLTNIPGVEHIVRTAPGDGVVTEVTGSGPWPIETSQEVA